MHSYPLNPAHVRALEARALDAEVITNLGFYSCRRAEKDAQDKTPIPDGKGDMLAFPYFDEDGKIVNTKYLGKRAGQKLYFQTPGGKKIFYNLPAALDTALQDPGGPGLVVVEGEMDTAAVVTAGHPWAISVPDGGSPDETDSGKPIAMKPDEELDPSDDRKFEFITNCWDLILPARKIILWTDWDSVGQRLRDELARRLDKVRCFHITRPSHMDAPVVKATIKDKSTKEVVEITRPVKDANEVLEHYGPEGVLYCISHARPIPIAGSYKMSDFEDRELITYSTGFKALDGLVKLYDDAFSVVSGLPQSGKSLLWNQIAYHMAENYGWRVNFGSFEAEPRPELQRQLRSFFIKKDRRDWTQHDVRIADQFIEEMFIFTNRDPTGIDDQLCTPEWCIQQLENNVIRYNVRMAIWDPWNQMDHRRRRDEMRDEYTINRIKLIKDAGKRMRVAQTIIAHPTAEAGRMAREGRVLSMYDMADGAAWNNAAEYGMIVHRRGMKRSDTICEPYVRKVKFQAGTDCYPGNCAIEYLPEQGRFDPDLVPMPVGEDIEASDGRSYGH